MRIGTLSIFVLALVGCADQLPVSKPTASSPPAPAKPTEEAIEKVDAGSDVAKVADKVEPKGEKEAHIEKLKSENLPNPIRVCDKVISGGLPEGDAAFAELKELGVKTVISVDGAKPDVETAKKHGLKYIHLPHGYDGVPENRVKELAKAVHDLDGPIYIHCHHGKHRSPAATSVACVTAGLVPSDQAVEILKLAGTGTNYKGLFRSAENAKPMSEEELDAIEVEFVETAAIPPIADAMVRLEHTFDIVKKLAENKWKPFAQSPDVDAAHEVLLLQEHYTEMMKLDEIKKHSGDAIELLQDSERAALALQGGVMKLQQGDDAETVQQLAKAVQRIEANCKKCHEQYRNVPLGEK
jgi:protein tyrosine phosphatase (PTP) superfamily phosphohydrolase (DUF442 family)/cytochrome c556